MKSLILSTSDIEGGAARAAYRLHQGLQAMGSPSQLLVRAKFSGDKSVIVEKSMLTKLGPPMNTLMMRRYPQRQRKLFSSQWFPDAIASQVARLNPDVVNLHWVSNGFLRIETLAKLKKPLFWTLQDMWPFTGGCHYSEACDRYQQACGRCPQLKSNRERDLSRSIWQRKRKAWKGINLTIVTPSHWMADCVRASSLLQHRRVEVIPFCLDTSLYRPLPTALARQALNLPADKRLVLFGALSATSDHRKGFHLLVPALKRLSQQAQWQDTVELAVFGSSAPATPVDLGFKAHYLGSFQDDLSLALIYSAADVMVVPSLYESFGQTTSEALACGTPVVAFNATGPKDVVDHQLNGYLASPYDVDDLAHGIGWILADPERHQRLSLQAREKAEHAFPLRRQAQAYLTLFEQVLSQSAATA
ncbi:Glycosyltransferase family 1 [Halomicronema hongdechloris C2206]|uniref:Glycosyltransferase family 1 n=1 Tax=Halomicronema hongdechloris C2206 TaxID=1641165 RepID=A0A1Z3HJF0_9CYAN|nr:glycosyltransferase family 4 protein [Halomicronema hongdechloris]ASC70442.1 Glycosyltransferase family 1 [Halomicronema hongdechloris C2206]